MKEDNGRSEEETTIILPAQQIGAAVAPWPSAITSVDDMAHKELDRYGILKLLFEISKTD
ncbi:hypothetical protein ABEB36_013912 [Hypothenemus hampei]|uniref:Uncharacterized protein n=1 Tax=Hypothenemus hampei TaxID=57062 RepID=A0ABD1E611_HYPHA